MPYCPRSPFPQARAAHSAPCRPSALLYGPHIRPDLVCLSPSSHLPNKLLKAPRFCFFCLLPFLTFELLLPPAAPLLLLIDSVLPLNGGCRDHPQRCHLAGPPAVCWVCRPTLS